MGIFLSGVPEVLAVESIIFGQNEQTLSLISPLPSHGSDQNWTIKRGTSSVDLHVLHDHHIVHHVLLLDVEHRHHDRLYGQEEESSLRPGTGEGGTPTHQDWSRS